MTIAIVSFKQLGDILMLEPASRLLAERSGEKVHLFAKRDFAPIIGLMPEAVPKMWTPLLYDELFALHEGTKATRRAATLLARRKSLVVSNPRSLRWEHRLVYGGMFAHPAGLRYMARYFFEEVGGSPERFTPPRLARPPESWRPAQLDLPDRYLVVHPTAAWRNKHWTPERWAATIDFLEAHAGIPVVVSAGGTQAERRHCDAILAVVKGKPLVAAGKTSIAEYAWLIANAAGLVAIDGSSCHFADAFSVPAVKLFGQTSEHSWFHARPDSWLVVSGPQRVYQRPPAAEIPLAAVLEATRAMLAAIERRGAVRLAGARPADARQAARGSLAAGTGSGGNGDG